jgi:hypothetical protein
MKANNRYPIPESSDKYNWRAPKQRGYPAMMPGDVARYRKKMHKKGDKGAIAALDVLVGAKWHIRRHTPIAYQKKLTYAEVQEKRNTDNFDPEYFDTYLSQYYPHTQPKADAKKQSYSSTEPQNPEEMEDSKDTGEQEEEEERESPLGEYYRKVSHGVPQRRAERECEDRCRREEREREEEAEMLEACEKIKASTAKYVPLLNDKNTPQQDRSSQSSGEPPKTQPKPHNPPHLPPRSSDSNSDSDSDSDSDTSIIPYASQQTVHSNMMRLEQLKSDDFRAHPDHHRIEPGSRLDVILCGNDKPNAKIVTQKMLQMWLDAYPWQEDKNIV